MTELRMWAAVFQEEYYEQHPKERGKAVYQERLNKGMSEDECDEEIAKMQRLMIPKKGK